MAQALDHYENGLSIGGLIRKHDHIQSIEVSSYGGLRKRKSRELVYLGGVIQYYLKFECKNVHESIRRFCIFKRRLVFKC